MTVDIKGASTLVDFEVIEIMDDINPYPALLGIDWATNMNGVINLEKWKIIFENKLLRVIVPLDPAEGSRYTEPVCDYGSDDDLDYIYKIKTRDRDLVNPIVDGRIMWDCESSCTSVSNKEIER